eukprot:5121590-Pleurochrysis_carterae.AAC.1
MGYHQADGVSLIAARSAGYIRKSPPLSLPPPMLFLYEALSSHVLAGERARESRAGTCTLGGGRPRAPRDGTACVLRSVGVRRRDDPE